MPSYCLVPCCKSSSLHGNNNKIFHVIPQDNALSTKWLEAIGRPDYAGDTIKKGSYRVCSDHFDESCYETKRILLRTAIPTLKLRFDNKRDTKTRPQNPVEDEGTSGQKNTVKIGDVFKIDEQTLRAEIAKRLQQEEEPRNPEQFLQRSRKLFGPETLELLTCQTLMKKGDKRKVDAKHKIMCLELYFHNPRAYSFMQQFIGLPSIRTLKRLYLNVASGVISLRCVLLLRSMASQMKAKDKYCVLGMASMKVRKHVYYDIRNDAIQGFQNITQTQSTTPAEKIQVLVLSGLFSTWTMPVAFAVAHSCVSAVKQWVDRVTYILMDEGFQVCAFVSDESDLDSKQLSRLRHICREHNYYTIVKKVVYYLFNVRFLVKSLLVSLMMYDMMIEFEGGVASGKHILAFYKAERELQTNLAPGLSCDQGSQIQLFSPPVVAAMRAFLKLNLLHKDATITVNLIDKVSQLLDLLNCSIHRDDSRIKKAFTGDESQEKVLLEMLDYLETVFKVRNGVVCSEKIEAVQSLMVTINSVLKLSTIVRNNGNNCLLRLLNLEFIEDCFKEIVASGKNRNNKCDQITTIEFMRGFNKCFFNSFIKTARLNSSKKIQPTLSKLHDYLSGKKAEKINQFNVVEKNKAVVIADIDHKISLPKDKIIRYIAAYLMTKTLEKHNSCVALKKYLNPSVEAATSFIDCEYLGVRLPVEFVLFVVKMENEFVSLLEEKYMVLEVGEGALKAMRKLVILPCACFPLFMVKKLFIRLRIYNVVRNINRQLRRKGTYKINRFDL